MSKEMLEKVVLALENAGIPTQRAMPAGKMGLVSSHAAAVQIQQMDVRSRVLTAQIHIFSSAKLGAPACEDKAMEAAEVLQNLGGKCHIGKCIFDGKNGLFHIRIQGEFAQFVPKITIDETALSHVVAFTSWRTVDEVVTDWQNAPWNFRLEEYFPTDEEEEPMPEESFTLTHTCANGTESYLVATWTYQKRVWDATGVRQIRLGTAKSLHLG